MNGVLQSIYEMIEELRKEKGSFALDSLRPTKGRVPLNEGGQKVVEAS